MATAAVVLVCFDSHQQMVNKLHELTAWTRRPDQVVVMHTIENLTRFKTFGNIQGKAYFSANQNDKGYRKCAEALEHVTADYVCFVNYDDHHDFHFLEKMMAAIEESPYEVDIAHCLVAGKHGYNRGREWEVGSSGRENNLIRTEYLRSIGGYEAAIAKRLKEYGPTPKGEAIKADKALIQMTEDSVRVCVPEILICML